MAYPLSRRELIGLTAAGCLTAGPLGRLAAGLRGGPPPAAPGWIRGSMTGARALVETLLGEGVECVFGIPGAQENELWDTMKSLGLGYLLVTHEFSATAMADGYARSTGKPGVTCIVPGPGLTNSLSGIGEALLDSIPLVVIVGGVANGEKHRAFQVHDLPHAELLRPVTKGVFEVEHAGQIPQAVREAFCLARAGEPGPAAVVIPYNLLIETARYDCPPAAPPGVPFDEAAFGAALALLADRKLRVGIYAGLGCMDCGPALACVAELLQAPVATSISGKGAVPEDHPLAVGWGYGPQGTRTAEVIFRDVDLILAIGVKFGEVSTGFYSLPPSRCLIHVDANPANLGRVMKTSVCVQADACDFLARVQEARELVCRPPDPRLAARIRRLKEEDARRYAGACAECGTDPVALLIALGRCTAVDALFFVDVTVSQYWAAELVPARGPRTFFNPTNNQNMGWSIPAAIGAQRAWPGRQTVTVTGDGCFLMSAMEMATAAREGLPVKFFVLDDQAYHYMQILQHAGYLRTTATVLARLDYGALAHALGVGYQEINSTRDVDAGVAGALHEPGPVLVRVVTDYGKRPVRWIDAARHRFGKELSRDQKIRFLTRIGSRALTGHAEND